jgi:hypothetical protein
MSAKNRVVLDKSMETASPRKTYSYRRKTAGEIRDLVSIIGSVLVVLAIGPGASASTMSAPVTAESADVRLVPRIKVVWFDPHDLLGDDFELVTQEVSRIFEAVDIEIAWYRSNGTQALRYPGEILSVLLPGGPHGWPEEALVMGTVNRKYQSVLRVFYGNVMRTLDLPSNTALESYPATERALIAAAVGRVLAHELIHAVDPQHPHAEQGLFRASLNKNDLTEADLVIDPASAAALHRALSGVTDWVARDENARPAEKTLETRYGGC